MGQDALVSTDSLPEQPARGSARHYIAVGTLLMAWGVGMGAFGAHALKETLSPYAMGVYEKAVFYHLLHGLGVVTAALSGSAQLMNARSARAVCLLFTVGILLFSGSLYLLALTEHRWLGAITPLGGTAFILAWLLWGYRAAKGSSLHPPKS